MNVKIQNSLTTSTTVSLNTSAARRAASLPSASTTSTPYCPNEFWQLEPSRVKANDITSCIIADCIVGFSHQHGDLISNLKLQKLLYYTQAWYLAINGKPLFKDRIEAWVNGPVQPEAFARYAKFGHSAIAEKAAIWIVSKKIGDHIADVMTAYGKLSSYDLERLSCEESPWKNAKKLDSEFPVISHESMRQFYKARLNEPEE